MSKSKHFHEEEGKQEQDQERKNIKKPKSDKERKEEATLKSKIREAEEDAAEEFDEEADEEAEEPLPIITDKTNALDLLYKSQVNFEGIDPRVLKLLSATYFVFPKDYLEQNKITREEISLYKLRI